jgi:predicted RecB family endonuclease
MARFLSEEWFALARQAVAAATDAPDGVTWGSDPVAVRHRVTGGPDGDIDYVVRAAGGRFSIEPAAGGPVDIEVVETYANAAAISQGRLTPAAAFAAGELKLNGDVALLAARQDDFAALGRLLDPVRAVTTY